MALEIERKFIFKGAEEYARELGGGVDPTTIKQGYLSYDDSNQVRVRIYNERNAELTYKKHISEDTRDEIDIRIPMNTADNLFALAPLKLVKFRYGTLITNACVDIDVYQDGLITVEIEAFPYCNWDDITIPNYCGEEVTGKPEYTNIGLALKFEENG